MEKITLHSNPQRIHPRHRMKIEDISFRVSKLEDMIKGNVKMDYLYKLENKMAIRGDLKWMAIK